MTGFRAYAVDCSCGTRCRCLWLGGATCGGQLQAETYLLNSVHVDESEDAIEDSRSVSHRAYREGSRESVRLI